MVDFLAPRMKQEGDVLLLEPLSVYAQALSFLNFLIADPIPAIALYRSGVLVQIPRPERYAVHKLILSQRRNQGSEAKARKDLAQADMLIRILANDRPYELSEAFDQAMSNCPKWREALDRALITRPELRQFLEAA